MQNISRKPSKKQLYDAIRLILDHIWKVDQHYISEISENEVGYIPDREKERLTDKILDLIENYEKLIKRQKRKQLKKDI